MDRARRKVISLIFADAAKYTLTAGAVGGTMTGKMSASMGLLLSFVFVVFILLAYFITPKETEE